MISVQSDVREGTATQHGANRHRMWTLVLRLFVTAAVLVAAPSAIGYAQAPPPNNVTYFNDPAPTVTAQDDTVVLKKELGSYPNYGVVDGRANILYQGEVATWTFTVPPSVDLSRVSSAFFRVSLIADDHYVKSLSEYFLAAWTNGVYLGNALADVPHGSPFESRFDNWIARDYAVTGAPSVFTITLYNTSTARIPFIVPSWFAIDAIELHLTLDDSDTQPPPPNTVTYFNDPAPTVTAQRDTVVLKKELGSFPNYGVVDGSANILYAGEVATWTFIVPPSVDLSRVSSAFFRASLIADDHYAKSLSQYFLAAWTNGAYFGNALADLPHGAPLGSRFNNWVARDYAVTGAPPVFTITLHNTSTARIPFVVDSWFAIDTIELHLTLDDVISDLTAPDILPVLAGTAGSLGWYVSAVAVAWTVDDPESGIVSYHGCDTTNVVEDTRGVTLTCTATNGVGLSASVPVTIKVDKTRPTISGSASEPLIWPTNKKLVPVVVSGTIGDATSGINPASATFRVIDEYGDVQPGGPIALRPDGTYSVTLMLQPSRRGQDRDGRQYQIVVGAADMAGNSESSLAVVTVPHDQRK